MKIRVSLDEDLKMSIQEYSLMGGGWIETEIPRDPNNETFKAFCKSKMGEIFFKNVDEWKDFLAIYNKIMEK